MEIKNIKRAILGLSIVAVFILTVTVASVWHAVSAAEGSTIEERIASLEQGFVNIFNMLNKEEEAVGGVTNFDQLEIAWLKTGKVASTTDGTWSAEVRLYTKANDQTHLDYWRNDTGRDAWVSLSRLSFKGSASSSFLIAVATSTRQANSATDYHSIYEMTPAGSASSTGFSFPIGFSPYIVKMFVGTSTQDFVVGQNYASSTPILVSPGGYVNLLVNDASLKEGGACVGKNDTTAIGTSGKCEAATSTARGFDLDAVIKVMSTTTPKEQF